MAHAIEASSVRVDRKDLVPIDDPALTPLRSERFVRVPAWFTAGAALRVATLKQATRILVESRSATMGFVDVARLRFESADVLVSRLATI